MSFGALLNIARSALYTQQRAMALSAQNIANARTPGYTRQHLEIETAGAWSGVTDRIERDRDVFLDIAWRRESGTFGSASTTKYYLDQVEAAVNEPSDSGVSAALNDFFQSFGALADDPNNAVAREEVRGSARRFIHHLKLLAQSLDQSKDGALSQLEAQIDETNALGGQIAELNEKILAASRSGEGSHELMDKRDQLLDQLSGLVTIQVESADDGTLTVMTGGVTLVTGDTSRGLELKNLGNGRYEVGSRSAPEAVIPPGGSIQALASMVSTRLPDLRSRLDRLAAEVVTRVNELHRQGVDAKGRTGINFFDPNNLTAGTISLSGDVLGSADAIAAGRSGETGDNSLALDISALGQKGIPGLDNRSFGSYYAVFVAGVGRDVRESEQDQTAAEALLSNADTARSSVSGVSTEEEMVGLIAQQESYSAAARLVGVADSMVQEILKFVA